MERQVIFRDRQEVTPEDLNNPQLFAQAAIDHVVGDGIDGGRKFTGFVTTQDSATEVLVASGRLYFDGEVYFRDEDGGVTLDLNGLKPNLLKRVVVVVASPQVQEVDADDRDFEVDAETHTYVPESVPMERQRFARLEAIAGVEAVSPSAPVIDAGGVVIAYVNMGPAGIESILRNTARVLPNLGAVAGDVDALQAFREVTEPQVSSLKSDLSRLANDLADGGDKELLLQVAGDLAAVKAKLDLPDTYVAYRALPFLDESQSDTGAGDYAARIVEGLRFPTAATASAALALLNVNQPEAKVSAGGGLLLPHYNEVERRITKGDSGTISLAEYSVQEARDMVKQTISRTRIRYGGDFEVTVGSAWWNGGAYADRLNGSVRNVFQKGGETFQVYETGKVDQDGHKIVRLAKFWTDEVTSPYWSRVVTEQSVLGYAHTETFLNGQDRWVTALGPQMMVKPANGSLIVGICKTYRGEPDFEQIIAMTSVDAEDLVLISDPAGPTKIAIEPTFLKGGERYGYFVVTQYGFRIQYIDAETAAAEGTTGTYFYGLNGGAWYPSPDKHLVWRDWQAVFPRTRVDIDLQPLQLGGGIQMIDILADSVRPGSTDLVFSVQVGGVYKPLDDFDPTLLNDLPAVLQFRVSFVGTSDVMPGLRLTGSLATTSRLALVAKHISTTKAIASSSTIVTNAKLRGFDGAHNTITFKIDRGPGTLETADSVVTITHPDGVIEKIATFNLAAATTDYKSVIDMTTDAAARPFTVAELLEIAE